MISTLKEGQKSSKASDNICAWRDIELNFEPAISLTNTTSPKKKKTPARNTQPFIMLFNYFKSKTFDPKKDIPSLKGKIILVTGGTDGMGKQSVLQLARHGPERLWIAARSIKKAEATVKEIKQKVPDASLKVVHLDLSSLGSVKAAAQTIMAESDRLDLVLYSAGVMTFTPSVTAEGYEIHFGVNYMGHVLLMRLLIPLMEKTSQIGGGQDVRAVMVSSAAYMAAPCRGINFNTVTGSAKNLFMIQRYGQSKLAVKLFAWQLAQEYPWLTAASVHPGLVKTDIIANETKVPYVVQAGNEVLRKVWMSSVQDGAKNQLWASVSKDVESGAYYDPIGIPSQLSSQSSMNLAKKLWDWTTDELESKHYKL
ncbi:hypothetical protein Golomagni_07035 [Golovinomyces magnicellulatus]|nr:hypothetical protein Golomagni_07035 [Golovinomyces magnicellulatus]